MLPVIRQLGGLEIVSITLLFPCQFSVFSHLQGVGGKRCFSLHSSYGQNEQNFFHSPESSDTASTSTFIIHCPRFDLQSVVKHVFNE